MIQGGRATSVAWKHKRSHEADLLRVPIYGVAEAAHHVDVPVATLRSWIVGRFYPVQGGDRLFERVIIPASEAPLLLSFTNLVEAHVLGSIRRHHGVRLDRVRLAVAYVERHTRVPSPLANQDFLTEGRDLFIEALGMLVNVSRGGQLAIPEVVAGLLRRIDRDSSGLALRLYPMLRYTQAAEAPRVVVIDPRISFGRPCLAGRGIPTDVLAERWRAGEALAEIAEDYDCDQAQVEQAVQWELREAA